MEALLAQVGYELGWPGFWLFLLIAVLVLGIVLYLLMRSQPPGGPPRWGE